MNISTVLYCEIGTNIGTDHQKLTFGLTKKIHWSEQYLTTVSKENVLIYAINWLFGGCVSHVITCVDPYLYQVRQCENSGVELNIARLLVTGDRILLLGIDATHWWLD